MFTSLILGLAGLATAMPSAEEMFPSTGGVIIEHIASNYFPHAKADVSAFDVSTHFTGYNSSMEQWLESVDPSTGANDREKAAILVSVAYARNFTETNEDMVADRDMLLAAIAGTPVPRSTLEQRDAHYIISHAHVVAWHACKAFFSCVSGTSCKFDIKVNKAPRSKCQEQGGSNCCISWSTYSVQAGFFSRTWTNCNAEVNSKTGDNVSCEGKGDNTGGDVCLSNRGSGCT